MLEEGNRGGETLEQRWWNIRTPDGRKEEHLMVEQWNKDGGTVEHLMVQHWNI